MQEKRKPKKREPLPAPQPPQAASWENRTRIKANMSGCTPALEFAAHGKETAVFGI